jgi:predicted methyltransferase
MPAPIRVFRSIPVLAAALWLAACATQPPAPAPKAPPGPPVTDAATSAALDRALAGPHRSAANRDRDRYRHPKETLEFFGLREDMAVMEVWPGAGGWWTEILAPVLHDKGAYYAAQWDPDTDSKYVQEGLAAFRAKLTAQPALYDRVNVVALQAPAKLAPVPPASLDLVLTFRNLHNWLMRDQALDMLRAIHATLKPGGILGIKDHRADPGKPVDPKAASGYVNEQYAIDLARQAGFELIGTSEVNANPADTRDWDQGVWTLPPTLRLGDKDRAKYLAIGESDRFTLRFRKPLMPPSAPPVAPPVASP